MRSAIVLLLLALGGCDRQSPEAPQANAAAAPVAVERAGTLDIARRGREMPGDVFIAPDGKPVTLAQFKGKPLLVNLWATWCGPCVKEMPTLDALAKRTGSRLKVLTVAQDIRGAEVVGPWFAKNRFARLEPYLDPTNRLEYAFETNILPTTVLYDAQGREVWRVTGGMDWDGPRANTLLAETLENGG